MLVVRERGLRTIPKTKVDAIAWWIDFDATTHVCKDRCWFKTFEPMEDGYVLYMGDKHFAPIHGKGSISLEFTSGKIVTLFNVFHLRIKESLRARDSDKGKGKEAGGPSVNMTGEGKNKHNKQNKGKKRSNENNNGSSSNKKPMLECWKCGKTGHFKRDCRSGKKNNANAGGLGKGSKYQSQDQGQN
nr:zinc finger, CCHC-type [Tanacetum cinerariifolium]